VSPALPTDDYGFCSGKGQLGSGDSGNDSQPSAEQTVLRLKSAPKKHQSKKCICTVTRCDIGRVGRHAGYYPR
jgi:hypothetical protein